MSSSTAVSDLIEKTILYPGISSEIYPDGTKVTFHLKVQLSSKDDQILDDSRKWIEPIELILGKKFKLEALEACVKTMTLNEVSKFNINKKLLTSYPIVVKTLRDHDAKKRGKKLQEQQTHCCGQQFKQGIGYSDLDEFMANMQDLTFTIELLKVELPGSYEREFWAMSEEEQKNSIPNLHDIGNSQYKAGNYAQAAKSYSEAIGRIESFMLKEKPHDDDWNKLNEKKIVLLLNYAQCLLNLEDFYSVIEHCSEVIKFQPANVKALFRRGKACGKVFKNLEARKDLEIVMKLDPSLVSSCKKLLQEMTNNENEKLQQDKKVFKNLFAN